MAEKPIRAFRVPPELEKEILSRGSFSEVVRRDLTRLYTLYRRALARIKLSEAEALLIADALNGTIMDAYTASLLWAQVEDAIHLEGLDKKWGVDGAGLVEKLRGLSDVESLALVDAAERFWEACARGEESDVKKYFPVVTVSLPGNSCSREDS